jgi:hypothetical protein
LSNLLLVVEKAVYEEDSVEGIPISVGEDELQLRVEEAICRYDGRILIGGEPRDAAEWAIREVSVWLRTPASIVAKKPLLGCVEDLVTKARKNPNSVDIVLREMVGRFVTRKNR